MKQESHGFAGTKIYGVWQSMLTRCYTPSATSYERYGARGITVCKRWRNSFLNFYEDMGQPLPGLSLDRVDNSREYCKENCVWSDIKTQARNRRSTKLIEYKGKTQCLQAWADELKISEKVISSRLKKGWKVKKALTIPSKKQKNKRGKKYYISQLNKELTITEAAEFFKIERGMISERILRGWTIDEAINTERLR